MDADILAQFQNALAEVTQLLGSCFVYNGTSYPAVINDVEIVTTLLDGGQLEGLATVIIVEKAQLPVAPTIGRTLKVDGKAYRVEKVRTDEISHEITCIQAAN